MYVYQVAERTDALMRLRTDARDAEDRLKDSLANAQHQTELVKQLREELKQAKAKVGACLFLWKNWDFRFGFNNLDWILV